MTDLAREEHSTLWPQNSLITSSSCQEPPAYIGREMHAYYTKSFELNPVYGCTALNIDNHTEQSVYFYHPVIV